MIHGKNPNRRQKQLIKAAGLKSEDWLVVSHITDKECQELKLEHRLCGKIKTLRRAV